MKARSLLLLLLTATAAGTAAANAGIPMLVLAWPAHWLAFIPVVAVESGVVAAALGTRFRAQLWPVAKANLLSTLIGIPVAWLAMLALEAGTAAVVFGLLPQWVADLPAAQVLLFPFMSAWIGGSNPWEFEVAFLVLSIPFFFVSVYVEYRSLRGSVEDVAHTKLRRAVLRGNALTYSLLCLAVVLGLLWATHAAEI